MSEIAWYRSLYWRVAIGFIGFLALLLVTPALLFIWFATRTPGFPVQSNTRLADVVATDVGTRLEDDPAFDIGGHIKSEYGRLVQPVVIVMADGRMFSSHSGWPRISRRVPRPWRPRTRAPSSRPARGRGRSPRQRRRGGARPRSSVCCTRCSRSRASS